MKLFMYLRVSGKGQVEGDGFTRQRIDCEKYAKSHEHRIVRVFRDEGVSGTTDLENRPALRELRAAMADDPTVGGVIIEALHRLARDLMVQETILADFAQMRRTVVSVAEPDLCAKDPTRILMRQMMGAIAQYEKTILVNKLRGARERHRTKHGRCEGRKPYGHDSAERMIVARILTLRSGGLAVNRIAAALNSEEIQPRTGVRWHGSTVRNILIREKAFKKIEQKSVQYI
jgi:DNA invertase Pin-like site-specific DNA recombinase